jgi:hypothetical protein
MVPPARDVVEGTSMMHRSFISPFAGALLLLGALACGGNGNDNPKGFGSDAATSGDDAENGGDAGAADGGTLFGDSAVGDGAGGCTGLQCQAVNCAAMGMPETTLTGTVRDPAGALPLYNVYAYVPNTKPDPIAPGNPTCTVCQAAASGNPILGTLTDSNGKFTLAKGPNDPWGIPAGTNIPLVLQVGKWRRQLVIPKVTACSTVDLDTVLGPDQMRLPKKSSEGDMPLIALTSAGYDAFECFLRVVGIDDSEIVAPTSKTGHVHFYTGADGDPATPASSLTGGNTVQDTFQWWDTAANLLKYDIVLNGCDAINGTRDAAAYTAMSAYLDGGGRVFATDSFEDWFGPPTGAAPFESVASWQPWLSGNSYMNYFADTSFPKGKAFGDWLVANAVAQNGNGGVRIALTDTYADVNASGPNMYPSSTRWIYNADTAGSSSWSTSYLSFNTPVGATVDKQCGRAVFSGVHVFLPAGDLVFPAECAGEDPAYLVNQHALEFLFFDLSSCIQNDQKPPPPPMVQ